MKSRRTSAMVLTATLFASIGMAIPAQAEGNAATYLNDPVFIELVMDMGYTAALLSDDSRTLTISAENISYNDSVPATKFADTVTFSSTASVVETKVHSWNTTSGSWGSADITQNYGFHDGTTYVSIDSFNDELGRVALKRLKKVGAKWAIKTDSFDGFLVGMATPFVLRPTLISSSALTSVGLLTGQGNGNVSNISVARNSPTAGLDTFTLTSTSPTATNIYYDFTFVVDNNRIVTSARQDEYITDANATNHSTRQEITIINRTSISAVASMVASTDKTVDYLAFIAMRGRITSERAITPRATNIKIKATVLSRSAKGKNKNVVTAKVIQNAAKALHITAKSTKSGIRLTGAIQFPSVRGYMCVSAVKKKAVVAPC